MQTFITDTMYARCAHNLDKKRLGKQRVECKQILLALQGKSKGWVNHPAVKMWRGYEFALCKYAITICNEWLMVGYKDTLEGWFRDQLKLYDSIYYPPWMDQVIHSHRCNLLRKDFNFYKDKFPEEALTNYAEVPYVWPQGLERMSQDSAK